MSKKTKNIKEELDSLLDLLKNTDEKKAHLLESWLITYVNYIKYEPVFDPSLLIRYPRGSIVFANLGFNVDREYGGIHYCIVLNKKDSIKNPLLNVIPLTSNPNKSKINTNVDLGTAVQEALAAKNRAMLNKTSKEQEISGIESDHLGSSFKSINDIAKTLQEQSMSPDEFSSLKSKFDEESKLIEEKIERLSEKTARISKEIDLIGRGIRAQERLKQNSIALVDQITTISKMRIIKPKYPKDPFAGIKIANEYMDKIDEKIKELFTKR
ncbi:MAG: type II toxin-antitoxin system PemK/MazF family toxin [Peptostreptococcaceae bacterium]|nr:type II toxin-antitoxin system PemK/MazF family toxin [Peptostreptococcaceae bacterium]